MRITEERKKILQNLHQKGDFVIFPRWKEYKLKGIVQYLNVQARGKRKIKPGELLYSIKRINKETLKVIRNR